MFCYSNSSYVFRFEMASSASLAHANSDYSILLIDRHPPVTACAYVLISQQSKSWVILSALNTLVTGGSIFIWLLSRADGMGKGGGEL